MNAVVEPMLAIRMLGVLIQLDLILANVMQVLLVMVLLVKVSLPQIGFWITIRLFNFKVNCLYMFSRMAKIKLNSNKINP